MRCGRHSPWWMPPHLSSGPRRTSPWSNFSLSINWHPICCGRLPGAGGAAACSAPRAASGGVPNPPVH